jgi:hypothetical protein
MQEASASVISRERMEARTQQLACMVRWQHPLDPEKDWACIGKASAPHRHQERLAVVRRRAEVVGTRR